MTLDESVHGMRLRVIERAQVVGNVSAVCRGVGYLAHALLSLAPTARTLRQRRSPSPPAKRPQPGRPVATAPEVERLVLGIAISAATWGCRRIAAYLARTWRSAPGTQHGAAAAAPGRPCHATSPPDRPRAAGDPHGRAADGADPTAPLARPPRPHAQRRGERSRASSCAWIPSTSAISKASARSGRSRPAMTSRATSKPFLGLCGADQLEGQNFLLGTAEPPGVTTEIPPLPQLPDDFEALCAGPHKVAKGRK